MERDSPHILEASSDGVKGTLPQIILFLLITDEDRLLLPLTISDLTLRRAT
jgi:hypothetical protein